MNACETLAYLTEREVERLIETARAFPADKLEWKPNGGVRSALDQLQEMATALEFLWPAFENLKLERDADRYARWKEECAQVVELDELVSRLRLNTDRLLAYLRALPPEDLDKPIDVPFLGMKLLVDLVTYHLWNCSYHEGQINLLKSQLEGA